METTLKAPEASKQAVKDFTRVKVLFVCSGNTCRSPMAAAILNHCGNDEYTAISAGIEAHDGDLISKNAYIVLSEHGMESQARAHRSQSVTPELVKQSDIIVGISGRHAMLLRLLYPEADGKIKAMPSNISDPFLQDTEVYRRCYSELCAGIGELFRLKTDDCGDEK